MAARSSDRIRRHVWAARALASWVWPRSTKRGRWVIWWVGDARWVGNRRCSAAGRCSHVELAALRPWPMPRACARKRSGGDAVVRWDTLRLPTRAAIIPDVAGDPWGIHHAIHKPHLAASVPPRLILPSEVGASPVGASSESATHASAAPCSIFVTAATGRRHAPAPKVNLRAPPTRIGLRAHTGGCKRASNDAANAVPGRPSPAGAPHRATDRCRADFVRSICSSLARPRPPPTRESIGLAGVRTRPAGLRPPVGRQQLP
jgi:hypothetical protein